MTTNYPIPPKAPNEIYTDSQWQAIYDQGTNLLVSASAGSGKTAVLVRRVIEKIKRQKLSVDQLLVVTFTEAAATEMKERVQTALQEAINEEMDQELKNHFAHQLTLLPTANISTLHSFCSKVIQRFFYLIDLDPSYRMLTDDTEMILLKEDVWDELRETFYEENQEIFYRLTENFSNDRSDSGLEDLILSMYEFARANPNPFQWLDGLVENYRVKDLAVSELYQQSIRPQVLDKLHEIDQMYHWLISTSQGAEELQKITELGQNEQARIQQIEQELLADRLSDVFTLFKEFNFPTYPSPRKKEIKELYGDVIAEGKAYRDQAKKELLKIKEMYFAVSPEEQVERLQAALPIVEELVRVEKRFIEEYSAKKREKGMLDFNDLEHFTLQILQTEINGDRPAENYYRKRFAEILVDEYQDINQLQETVLRQLSREKPGNLFMVGDVKQSIYGFRLADPTLFIQKYHDFSEEHGGRRIILAENFRSRKEVLDFTNLIFTQLMDPTVGQIEYDEQAELINGFTNFPDTDTFAPELLIYQKDGDVPEWIEDKSMGEIFMTAMKIRQLIDQKFEIYDKEQKEMRAVRYEDIVLLIPTRSNNLTILEVFKQLGIPLAVNDTQNYFQSTELRIMIALLQIIDNPYQDIPLAAVLRSPIVGLQEEELAQIRLALPQKEYYQAVKRYLQDNENQTAKKLAAFMSQLNEWREFARRESLADLLVKIYNETAYLDYVLGMPAGQQRHANLLALIERAKDYERSSFRGLYQFIRFIEKMQEKDKDLGEPPIEETRDAVRVMTIHGSKGLEFPIVFLMDMSKSFNLQDTRRNYVFDERLGLGVKLLTPDTRIRQDTLLFQTVKQKNLNKLLSEEMRKLYVALTRAEQKLFLVGSYENEEATYKTWSKGALNEKIVLDAGLRSGQKDSFFDWVGLTLFRHPIMENYQKDYQINRLPSLKQHPAVFKLNFIEPQTIAEAVQTYLPAVKTLDIPQGAINIQSLKQRLSFKYPYPEATKTTSYQSVSELKRLYDDPDNQENIPLTPSQPNYRFTESELGEPKFLGTKKELSAAEIGTATHLVMQLLPLTEIPQRNTIENLIEELLLRQTLTSEIAEKISIDSILQFFDSPFGRYLVQHANHLYREEPFAMLLPADQLFSDYQNQDEILIHGIIDGYLEFDDKIILYDLKTDYYTPQKEQQLINRYRGQLYLYKDALEKAKQKPVEAVYLIFLRANQTINLLKTS
ncbi:helicase-exonuclease AddAB subunit AddA [Enterococcus dongliensis]|uniref:helicase-exonuclease AddAB subunit AddA n=1 Tax=Enterococcus dongliensis TaxID=2559925 RepID=UPI00288DE8C5|nr:helicase-exonuclease AddAB subunit AddA [Enterococcus dongliensis]MDT2602662.1 helicase-exonuclease AddAB subunit AddA [Enterococcus dongliensis]MDT2643847.1 helicase-exonuclease AddAB subunit AddA [Enterococcus dongliensis]MDT2670634.1 helicase-exonuclease AddAB subunit AddA [Enterococcus dongliensis]MDT2710219.1 helicase-exonuclease AddAB subunit AddA [Enterococcus dongliensis]